MICRRISFSLFLILAAFISALLANAPAREARVSISWNVTAETKEGRTLLNKVFGYATHGRMHAILGPSGSGKTTLLNTLAAEIPKGSLKLTGAVDVSDAFEPLYIQQEDLLFAQLTSKETLEISYDLRKESSLAERDAAVANTLNSLGLKKVTHTKVGDKKTRGLSGGEKKRLDIGNEIIDHERGGNYIFADEPTSGLDCFQAERVVQILQSLAAMGSTVIFSIHQPRASIYELFEDISLISEGRVIYSGTKKNFVPHFESLGYSLPPNVSPAEYYVDLVSVDYSSPEEEVATKKRIHWLADQFAQSSQSNYEANRVTVASTVDSEKKNAIIPRKRKGPLSLVRSSATGLFRGVKRSAQKFAILYSRAWKQVTRDKSLNIARFASSIFSSLLFGAIYFRMGKGVSTIADRLGLLQVAAINCAMTSLIKATTSFVTEKLIVQKERKRGSYGVLPYFLAKIVAEIPLSSFFPALFGFITYKLCGLNPAPGKLWTYLGVLIMEAVASTSLGMSVGALVPTAEAGIAVSPAVMVIFIVFGGLYVVNTPSYLKWVPNVSVPNVHCPKLLYI